MKSIIDFAHQVLRDNTARDDIALDLTIGNGHDTLLLVELAAFVYGFDIQEQAILETKKRLSKYNNYLLIHDNHINFLQYAKNHFNVAIMNLGYLPGGNKQITTMAISTLPTVEAVLKNINVLGILIIVVYPGHKEGKHEGKLLDIYLSKLNQQEYSILKYQFINQKNNPPYLLIIRRLK